MSFSDCDLLVQIYDPKDAEASQLGFCLYPLVIERGIFVKTTCVGVLIEPETGTRNAFYGKNGHWGIEGKCEATALKKKFGEPQIDQTVNPVTSLRLKNKEGQRLRCLRDSLGIWETLNARTKPVP